MAENDGELIAAEQLDGWWHSKKWCHFWEFREFGWFLIGFRTRGFEVWKKTKKLEREFWAAKRSFVNCRLWMNKVNVVERTCKTRVLNWKNTYPFNKARNNVFKLKKSYAWQSWIKMSTRATECPKINATNLKQKIYWISCCSNFFPWETRRKFFAFSCGFIFGHPAKNDGGKEKIRV